MNNQYINYKAKSDENDHEHDGCKEREYICRHRIVEHWCDCYCIRDCPPEYHKKEDCNNGSQGGNPNRPGKTTGTSRGTLNDPSGLTIGDLTTTYPPGSWGGERKNYQVPFLFMRENPGDLGTRLNPDGTRKQDVFWESPDVLIMAGIHPAIAPARPPVMGQTALVDLPNTIYAHIWNFGLGCACDVVVEFFWCDPSLGIGPGSAQKIGQVDKIFLGAKGSGQSHKLIKCPEPWFPKFLNGGHECLLVRVWNYDDVYGNPAWDASVNRHIGQRNIHVINTFGNNLMKPMGADVVKSTVLDIPITLKVGPTYGASAQVSVARVVPGNMPWLQLHTGVRGKFPQQAVPTGTPILSRPAQIGGGIPTNGASDQHVVKGDDQQVAFSTTDKLPLAGEAHIYRVTASQGSQIFGGYTVVLIGS